ncbi:M20 aminoacylase family protein [Sphingomonas crocodyli]|uniref:Amidohydrolase n=1 Tax=Sphingomonas crocodyli TaxID=1979270 RepID=A0A437M5C1_9SPHN|nr:M20 aminoacylase family protein [Sphingomonas crocodyli]RVT92921.1 amidohydrolase [Sphingomonas crocodyli]
MATTCGTNDILSALVAIRRDLHAYPELGFKEQRTAARIADFLEQLGLEVHRNIGTTGVVGVLKVGNSSRSVGLRADMDALPIQEMTGLDYASRHPNVFHGCGHDGHVAMLLGAAQELADKRDFDGTVNFIFQPAEEGLGGARAMIEDGLFQRFPCDRVFGIHNWPGLPEGVVATRPGPIMAAADKFEILIEGKGGHAAQPETASDVVAAAAQLALQLKTLVARCASPSAMAVLSVTRISAGHTHNVLPASAIVGGTVRTFDADVQDRIEAELRQAADGIAMMTGTRATIDYDRYYPATINDPEAANDVMTALNGVCSAQIAQAPALTSEDFAFMLQACKGAYLWLGQAPVSGAAAVPLHHPGYDFNDAILPHGIAVNVALARHTLGTGQ